MKKTETINICGSGTFPKGNPCHVPNTNIGSFTTNPITYNNPSIGTIIGGLNNTVPTSYVPVTNPYITQSSTFPTFTPPVFQTPITKPIQSESKNIPSDLIPYFASHSGKVIGWLEHQNNTLNLNFNIAGKDLDMSNKQITDENMLFFCQKMAGFTFHFDNLVISNNLMTDLSVQYLFNATLTSPTNRTIKNLDLRNNQIGDVGAELIAAYLKHGYMPATTHVNLANNIITDKGAQCFAESLNSSVNKLKVLHLEGNKFSTNGIGHFVKALESPKVIDVSIVFEIANKSKTVIDFIEKGLKYAIKQHAQSKWEVDKIRSNVEGEKWKGCKDMALNVGMGLMSDAKTCLGFKSKEAIFACVTAEVGWELFRPETVDCYIETCKVVGEVYDDNCSIF